MRGEAATLARAGAAAFGELRSESERERASSIEPYRLDPILPLREGRITVWDPDAAAPVVWEPWPNQEEGIATWIDVEALAHGRLDLRNVHIEKSRQEGDTTAFAYAVTWILNYWPVPLLVQHQDLGEIADSGLTYDSFFGKVRFIWENWPRDLGRAPLAFTGGNNPIIRRADVPTGFLVGEGQTPDPGRGGRYRGAIIDEAARLHFDRQGQAALTRAVPVGRVMLSTPHGEGNVYFEMRERRPRGWTFLRHHWTDHPLYSVGLHVAGEDPECVKCAGVVAELPYDPHEDDTHRYPGKATSPWYDEAVRELTDEQVAQELDIDYAASLVARVYPEFDAVVHVHHEPIPYDPALRIEIGWDYGVAPTAGVICQESPFEYRAIADFEVWDATPEAVDRIVRDELRAHGVTEAALALSSEMFLAVGDPAGEARQLATGRPLVADYRALGWSIASRPARIASTINAVKRLLSPGQPKPLRISPTCTRLISHFKANRWPTDRRGARKPDAREPVNDEHNHMMRAFAYLVHYKWPTETVDDSLDEARARYLDEHGPSGRISGVSYDEIF